MGASPPVQQTAVETTVAAFKNKQTTNTNELLAQLEAEGVAPAVAVELVSDPKMCLSISQQLEYLEAREPKDRAATLVASIRGEWSAPRAYREQQQAQERQRQEQERRQQGAVTQKAAEQARRESLSQAAAEVAALDAQLCGMSDEQRAAIDTEALKRLGPIGRRESAKGALEAMRRQVLREAGRQCEQPV